jgi:cytochrome c2
MRMDRRWVLIGGLLSVAGRKESMSLRRVVVNITLMSIAGIAGSQDTFAEANSAVFKRYCSVCHSIDEGKNKIGPSLAHIVGRQSASIPNFGYSEPMRKLGVVRTLETLDRFLVEPQKMVPGTQMTFPGIKIEEDRRALIRYLAEPEL